MTDCNYLALESFLLSNPDATWEDCYISVGPISRQDFDETIEEAFPDLVGFEWGILNQMKGKHYLKKLPPIRGMKLWSDIGDVMIGRSNMKLFREDFQQWSDVIAKDHTVLESSISIFHRWKSND